MLMANIHVTNNKTLVETLSYHVKLVTRCWLLFSKSASPYKMCYVGHIRLNEPLGHKKKTERATIIVAVV